MSLKIGTWHINQNGFEGDLIIRSVDGNGNVRAKIVGVDAEGLWDARSQKLTLIRKAGTNADSIQVFTGYQFLDEIGTGPYLAGTFEAFKGTGANASRIQYGWWATGPSKWQPVGTYSEIGVPHATVGVCGPCGGKIDWIDISPDYDGKGHAAMYLAASGSGVWRSTDFTSARPTWKPLTDRFPNLPAWRLNELNQVTTLAVDPKNPRTIYARAGGRRGGTLLHSLLKSTDGGDKWTLLDDNLFAGTVFIWKVLVDPTGAVYIGFDRGGLWRSTDGGQSWTNIEDNILKGVQYTELAYEVSNGAVTIYAGVRDFEGKNRNGIWSWSNQRWTQMKMTLTNVKGQTFQSDVINCYSLYSDPTAGVYAALSQREANDVGLLNIFKLVNDVWQPLWFSQSFVSFTQNGYDQALCVSPDGTIYFGGIGISQSVDGKTITDIAKDSKNICTHTDQHAIKIYQGKVYVGNDGGVWRFTPRANKAAGVDVWESLNTPSLLNFLCSSASAHPTNPAILLTGNQDNRIARRYPDGEWKSSGTNERQNLRFDPYPRNQGKYAYAHDPQNTFYWSQDAGISFSNFAPAGAPSDQFMPVAFAFHPKNSERIMIGWEKVYETADRGKTWKIAKTFPRLPGAVTYAGDKAAYIGVGDTLYETLDDGQSWSEVNFSFGNGIVSLCADPAHSEAIYVATALGIFRRLTPQGLWEELTGNLASLINVMALMAQPGGADPWLFIGTMASVFVASELKGASTCWARFGKGFPDVAVTDLEVTQATGLLLAATWGRGSWATIIGPKKRCP